MSPATIERRRLGMRDDDGQLTLEGLSPARRPSRIQRTAPQAVPGTAAPARPPAIAAGGTLDDLITGVWRELGAQRAAACPVCGDHLEPRVDTRVAACRGCGSTLG